MWNNFKMVKIRVFVPKEAVEKIRLALGEAGAGKQGNYDFCSCTYNCEGRFRPLAGARPTIGKIGDLEMVEEMIVEAICEKKKIKEVVAKIKSVHPYEEPAIDIIPLLKI